MDVALYCSVAREVQGEIKEAVGKLFGKNWENDAKADMEANNWGRSGGDPNIYRPKGLDPKH